MVSMECASLFSASFTQETRSWSWPMLPPWRLALARSKASPRRTPRTLSKLSERSAFCFYLQRSINFLSTPSQCLLSFPNMQHLSPLCADSLLGFLRLWRNGRDRGVAAGRPTHPASDTWTQSQFQLEGNANAGLKDILFIFYFLALLSFGSPELLKKKKYLFFNPRGLKTKLNKTKQNTSGFRNKKKKDIMQKKKKMCIRWSKCIQKHCSGMRKDSLCGDHSKKWATKIGVAFL